MNSYKLIKNHYSKLLPIAVSCLYPGNLAVVLKNFASLSMGNSWGDRIAKNNISYDDIINRGLDWIKHSQDIVGSGGVGCYEFYRWTKGYPEVTGYIIPTFWDCYLAFNDPDLRIRAIKMAEWELAIQHKCGGWEGFYEGDKQPPVVFNSGQVIRGLNRTFSETGDSRYLDASIRAAEWIVKNQEQDGSWTLTNYKGMKRVYDTYVAAPLSQLWKLTNDEKFAMSAERNCIFAIKQQQENGWFNLCDNTLLNNEAPVTHTIAYTIDGLIETGIILNNSSFIHAGEKAAESVLHKFEIYEELPARFDNKWKKNADYICNTGVAQMGIIFIKLYEINGDPRYLNAALKMLDYLSFVQDLNSVGKHRNGGLTGSYPVWGMYCPMKYPSWATKYLIDLTLLVRKHVVNGEFKR